MKADEKLQHLKDLAEKLGITVTEENLKISGMKVKSGYCVVKGEKRFILDKHKSNSDKASYLANCLSKQPLDTIYVIPAIRELLEKYNFNTKDDNVKEKDIMAQRTEQGDSMENGTEKKAEINMAAEPGTNADTK